MSAHAGTHLDPPRHFFAGDPVDSIPLDRLIGPCLVADLTRAGSSIHPDDLEAASIPAGTRRLLFKTPNSRLWDDLCAPFRPDFVDLSLDGASWVTDRGILLVGIDYLSIEGPADSSCPVHRHLLSRSVVILEGLDLRAARPGPYTLVCLPLRTMNGDGAPARVVLIDP